MKKEFNHNGFQFEVVVKLDEAQSERKPNGKTTYPVTARDLTGKYNVETEITTGGSMWGNSDREKELKEGVEKVIADCKKWADNPTKENWEKDTLSQQGFKD